MPISRICQNMLALTVFNRTSTCDWLYDYRQESKQSLLRIHAQWSRHLKQFSFVWCLTYTCFRFVDCMQGIALSDQNSRWSRMVVQEMSLFFMKRTEAKTRNVRSHFSLQHVFRPRVLKLGDVKGSQGGSEYGNGILKSSIMANKLLFCFFVFDCEVRWGAGVSD